MYLRILKKDLKRKKTMNVILLLFITLATMFVASSVNNILTVTTALDDYLDMADAPDYFVATMNKSAAPNLDETLNNAKSIDDYKSEEILYMAQSNILYNNESLNASSNTQLLQGDRDISMNYILDDGSILESVPEGKFYATTFVTKNTGLEVGDKITIDIEGISKEFTFAGSFRDAVLGSEMMGMTRFIINSEEFEEYTSSETIDTMYGGKLCYIKTSDAAKVTSEISDVSESFVFTGDRSLIKFSYVFDMMITGILLVVSLILIIIAFVVLRFTITFTLSEEFREIGVMKAIGIGNTKIRGLYLIKYAALSVIGSVIGLLLSFPFGKMLMNIASESIIINNNNVAFINILCAVFVIGIILLFCYGCTRKVKKMTPIDAIRNGQTGERFRKKSLMSLGKSRINSTAFLAVNDVVSSPKRYGIITFTFFLCLSLLFILSNTVTTLKSDSLLSAFSLADCDVGIYHGDDVVMKFMVEGGREKLEKYLNDMEETFAENDMPAECIQEIAFNLAVIHDEYKMNISVIQGTGTTMDMYEYTEGTVPQNTNEIAITKLAAEGIKADIGDTVTITTVDGEKEYIITAFYQTMNTQGVQIRLHTDEYINYVQASGSISELVKFTDNPDDKEILKRIDKIKELYPDAVDVDTAAEFVKDSVGVADTIDTVKSMFAILTIVLSALITVLMERSFIAKEQGEIALMKAIGTKNSVIYTQHTARFAIVGIIAIIIAEIFAMPLTSLCINPIFRMMGLEIGVEYVTNPIELYLIFPILILVTTMISAFLTALYTKSIKASDASCIE